jgi:hypothetical protein
MRFSSLMNALWHKCCRIFTAHLILLVPAILAAARTLPAQTTIIAVGMDVPSVQSSPDPPDRNLDSNNTRSYSPITATQRFYWFAKNTLGPESLVGGMVSAGFGTAIDKPREYGPHWDGFASRYGMRLTGVSTSNAMEASLGAFWGEDPRYFRAANRPFGYRVKNIIKMTFTACRRDGSQRPAYARFIAIPGNNFLSNTWRADSEATIRDAGLRTVWGVLGRMAGNAFSEFWPDVVHLGHKNHY